MSFFRFFEDDQILWKCDMNLVCALNMALFSIKFEMYFLCETKQTFSPSAPNPARRWASSSTAAPSLVRIANRNITFKYRGYHIL